MRLSLTPILLAAALLLSGCVVEQVPETQSTADDPAPAQSDPPQQEPAPEEATDPQEPPAAAPHGEPQVTEGPIESGTGVQQVPGAWARRAVTITNDANGADLMALNAAIAAGSIRVLAQEREGYLVEVIVESRAATEADARAQVERAHVVHEDVLDGSTLRLRDHVEVDPVVAPLPLPPGVLENGLDEATLAVHFTITVPLGPAVELVAHSASGDLSAEDLAGPRVELSTASGDVSLASLAVDEAFLSSASGDLVVDGLVGSALNADSSSGDIVATDLSVRRLTVSTSSGDIAVAGAIDDLDAGTSSGDVSVEATPAASGGYAVSTASGDVVLDLAQDGGQAYHVAAGTASGDIVIDLPDGEVLEDKERRKEVASAGFDDAAIQTSVDVGTSSGDITVTA